CGREARGQSRAPRGGQGAAVPGGRRRPRARRRIGDHPGLRLARPRGGDQGAQPAAGGEPEGLPVALDGQRQDALPRADRPVRQPRSGAGDGRQGPPRLQARHLGDAIEPAAMRGLRAALAPALALSGGVVWGLTFGRSPWSIAPWLALAPLVVLLGRPRAGGLGFLFGLASWTVGLSWIPATLIQFGGLPRPVALLCLLLLASYLALFQLAFAKLGRGLWLAGGAAALLGLPALWVALEWLRAHFLGGFPWNLAAYSWIAVPGALPLSAWIGAYGVSFVVVFANVSLAQALVRRRIAPAALGVLLPLLALGLAGRASYRDAVIDRGAHLEANDFGRPVRIVQPNIPVRTSYLPAQAYADYRRTLDLAAESCEPGALVLLPESAL